MKEVKNTTIKIDARDWTGDPRIRMVSLAARGLWLECLCLMRTAPRTGYLETTAGTPVSDGALARIACAQEADITALRRELADNAIPSVEEGTGVWYCRRMADEASRSEKCSAAGRKGGGNPAFSAAPDKEAAPRRTRAHAGDVARAPAVEETAQPPADSPAKDAPAKDDKPKPRNPLMDALGSLEGDIFHLPAPMWSKVAKALKNIKSATPDVTPEEIARRAANYPTHFRDAMLTCTALASHWARCERACQTDADLFAADKAPSLRNPHVYVKPYEG